MNRLYQFLVAVFVLCSIAAHAQTYPGEGVADGGQFPDTGAMGSGPINGNTNYVRVQAMAKGTPAQPIISTCGLTFARGTTTPTGIYGEVLNVPSGIYWQPQYSNGPVKVCEFGVVTDGTLNQLTNVMTGTDNTSMIQAALDYAMQNNFTGVCFPDGKMLTNDSLHVGWGSSSITLGVSSCSGSRGYYALSGSSGILYNGPADRCAVYIQSTRLVSWRGLSVVGKNLSYFLFGGFPWMTGVPWPITPLGYYNPSLLTGGIGSGILPGGIQRYAPYAGVCADAFNGPAPMTLAPVNTLAQYPFTIPPAWTGHVTTTASITAGNPAVLNWPGAIFPYTNNTNSVWSSIVFHAGSVPAGLTANTVYYLRQGSPTLTVPNYYLSATPTGALINLAGSAAGLTVSRQFGMPISSETLLVDGDIYGFAVAANSNSSAYNANGDFFKMNRMAVGNCVYCISIGNDQSRSVDVTDLSYAFAHTVLVNTKFGVQNGRLGGPLNNWSGGNVYQMFDIGALTLGAPTEITNFYCETCVRLGVFTGGSQANSVTIQGGQFAAGPFLTFLEPVAFIESPVKLSITLNDVAFGGSNRIPQLAHGAASLFISGGQWVNGAIGVPFLKETGWNVAMNYTGGMFVSGTNTPFPVSNGQLLQFLAPVSAQSLATAPTINFTGSMSVNTLTVTAGTVGTNFATASAQPIQGQGVQPGAIITAQLTGTGGASCPDATCNWGVGTYSFSGPAQTVASEAMFGVPFTFLAQLQGPNLDFLTFGVRAPFTQASIGWNNGLDGRSYRIAAPPGIAQIQLNSGSYTSVPAALNCDVLTFTYLASLMGTSAATTNINVGDQLYFTPDGTYFVVTNVAFDGTNYPITARQSNNMTLKSDSSCLASNISSATLIGNTTIIRAAGVNQIDTVPRGTNPAGNILFARQLYYGDFANGSTTISNISVSTTSMGSPQDTYIKATDTFWPAQYNDPTQKYPFAPGAKITSVTNNASVPGGSAVLSLAANLSGRFPITPLSLSGGPGQITNAINVKPTATGTCGTSATVAGNAQRGTITMGGVCAANATFVLNFAASATVGWDCKATNRTAPIGTVIVNQTATAVKTATMQVSAATGAADVIGFQCEPY